MFVLTLLFVATACVSSGQAETRFLREPSGSSRIIHGTDAVPSEFPHQASLLRVTVDPITGDRRGSPMCGASVIGEGWVLTAGHCVDGQSTSGLAIAVDLHDFSNPGKFIWFDVDEIILHERYNQGQGGFPNDVALLLLRPNGNSISKNIVKIADGSNVYDNRICTISGWGVTVEGSSADVLQKADVTVLTENACKAYWGSNILSQHVCVKGYDNNGYGRGSCNGDSGGPLVCLDGNDQYELVGVTSWGRSGCHDGGVVTHPSVYARVTSFYSWINANCGNCAA